MAKKISEKCREMAADISMLFVDVIDRRDKATIITAEEARYSLLRLAEALEKRGE